MYLGFSSLIPAAVAPAWTQGPPPSLPRSMSQSWGLQTFPAKHQTAGQQQPDEMTCCNRARRDSGFDRVAVTAAPEQAAPEQTPAPAKPSAKGAGIKGAAAGAAAGAVVGAIAGDAGKSAAAAARPGAPSDRRQSRRGSSNRCKRSSRPAKTETEQKLDGFRQAFSACMEARDYVVK